MNATLDIPADLYRRVQAKSASEGKPLNAVAIQLFHDWLGESDSATPAKTVPATANRHEAPWLAITQPYVEVISTHDLTDIRQSVHQGLRTEDIERYGAHFPQ